jgi:Fe-S-cluster containining protein
LAIASSYINLKNRQQSSCQIKMSRDYPNNIYFCTGCGDCCRWPGHVKMKNDEADKIADHLNIPVEQFIESYTELTKDRKALTIIDNEKGQCTFFDDEANQCNIYQVRPKQCQGFPNKWNFDGWREQCPAIELKYKFKAVDSPL